MTATLGPPAKTEGGTSTWYGLANGKTCYAPRLSSSHSELGTVDEALCK